MKVTKLYVCGIPAILYGEATPRVVLYVHGKCGNKEEAEAFAGIACARGWQVLSFDLPGHGERATELSRFVPWETVPEITNVYRVLRRLYGEIACYGVSIGAWFTMLALQNEALSYSLFVSPVLDMESLILTEMKACGITENELRDKGCMQHASGAAFSWEYLRYAREHPTTVWRKDTAVLYAGRDGLTARETVLAFCERSHSALTVMEDGEHWFHTPEQLSVLRAFEQASLPKSDTCAASPIHTVFFDLDDTLFDFTAAERAAFSETLNSFGIEPSPDILALYHAINAEKWRMLERGELSREEVLVDRFADLLKQIGSNCPPVKVTALYEQTLSAKHMLCPGAEPLLRDLFGRFRLVAVSNGTAAVQHRRLHDSGIESFFEAIFISEEIGAEKPTAAFFDACFAAVPSVNRAEVVLVGDSLTSDICGGKNAGLLTVWIRTDSASAFPPRGAAPDFTVDGLDALRALLVIATE